MLTSCVTFSKIVTAWCLFSRLQNGDWKSFHAIGLMGRISYVKRGYWHNWHTLSKATCSPLLASSTLPDSKTSSTSLGVETGTWSEGSESYLYTASDVGLLAKFWEAKFPHLHRGVKWDAGESFLCATRTAFGLRRPVFKSQLCHFHVSWLCKWLKLSASHFSYLKNKVPSSIYHRESLCESNELMQAKC